MDKDSDENLREQLKAYRQDVGPINNSTRPYWQKALAKLTLQLGVSPIQCASDQKESPFKKERNGLFRSRSVDSPLYTSDESFSESDDDSILTDGPGSTPFPAKVSRNKNSSSREITSSSNKTLDSPGNIKKASNLKNVHLSTTPKSIRNRQVKVRDKKFYEIPQKDRELRESLKAYGECVNHSPMNEATRSQWKKRLDKLTSGVSPAATNSDSEIVYYSPSLESSRRVTSQIGYFGVSDDDGEEYEHVDSYENKEECRIENIQTFGRHFCEHLMSVFSFLLRGIVCFVVIITGILLVGFPKDDDDTLKTNL